MSNKLQNDKGVTIIEKSKVLWRDKAVSAFKTFRDSIVYISCGLVQAKNVQIVEVATVLNDRVTHLTINLVLDLLSSCNTLDNKSCT